MINDISSNPQEQRQSEADAFRAELEKLHNAGGQEDAQEATNDNEASQTEVHDESERSNDDAGDTANDNDADEEQDLDDPDHDTDTGRMIPKGRFNKALQQRNQEREARIKAETELQIFKSALEKFNTYKNANDNTDDRTEFEPLDYEADRAYKKYMQQQDEKIQYLMQENEARQFEATLNSQAKSYAKIHPDYDEGVEHVIRAQAQIYKPLYNGDFDQAYQVAQAQFKIIAQNAIKEGKNAVQIIYQMAKDAGYTPKSKGSPSPNLDMINTNMAKSKIANVKGAAVTPSSGAGNMTDLETFNKNWEPGDVEGFYALLEKERKSQKKK